MRTRRQTETSTRHTQQYRQRKRLLGICFYGGCWEPAVQSYCEKHRAQNRSWALARYARKHANLHLELANTT
jgi:hypothetical protein